MPDHIQGSWRWCSKCQGMFWAGPVGTAVHPSCKPLLFDIQGLQADKQALQEQLQGASTQEKPALAAAINNLSAQINSLELQLAKCVADHRVCPAGGTHSGASSGEYRIPQLPRNIRLHFKILTAPTKHPTSFMLAQMRQVYNAIGIGVDLGSTEFLNLPDLTDLDVGSCLMGSPTDEVKKVFANRKQAGINVLVIYFVRSSTPPLFDRLMTGQSRGNLTNPPPNVIGAEVATMKQSSFTSGA